MSIRMHEHLSLLVKPAGADCNLSCDYCFYHGITPASPSDKSRRMTEDTLEILIRNAQSPARTSVSYIWQGGEPMLMGIDFYRTALELQGAYEQPEQRITNTIQTNAIGIDDQWAAMFRRNNILVGVSLDGPRELHDRHRTSPAGAGVFDRVLDACRILDRHRVEYNILAVVTTDTVIHPERIYDFFREQGFSYLQFIPCVETVDGAIAPFSLEPDPYGEFLCRLFDRWLADGYPQVSIRLFDNYLQYRAGLTPECCLYKNECGEYLVVEHNGDLFPCDFFVRPEWKLGTVAGNGLDAVIDSPRLGAFAGMRTVPHDECEDCPHLGFCQRGCIRFREMSGHGTLNHLCRAYKHFLDHADDAYRFLAWDIMRRRRGEPVPDIGRNDPCPCGSGRTYADCCRAYEHLLRE